MEHNVSSTDKSAAPAAVCVLTARGMAAIASVALSGAGAGRIVEALLEKPAPPCGRSIYGTIKDNERVIDSVVAACESPACFVIHCHGNPLLVEQLVRLCRRHGAVPQQPDEYLFARYLAASQTLIEAEARLVMTQAVTRQGATLLHGQIAGGLSAWARRWIICNSFNINQLKCECADIIERSRIARRIIEGVRIALVGPPNSGKSTLLNWLAGTGAALVSETAGTTRDWVSAVCRIGPLRAEIIDTAGLDMALTKGSELDRAAQDAARRVMESSDLVLKVQDCTKPPALEASNDLQVPSIEVFTKSDMRAGPEPFLPAAATPWVLVSAKAQKGLEELCTAVISAMQAESIPPDQAVCFTQRQHEYVRRIAQSPSKQHAADHLAALLETKAIPASRQ